jgi:hypothetical protein
MKRTIAAISILIALAAATGLAQAPPRTLLNRLEGSWFMTGSVLQKPVQYTAEGSWVLLNQFFCLHMKDTALPPRYEADVYIGLDSAKNQYVAHWLDSFGGTGSRVVGLGPVSGDVIEIIYPYDEGRFRNRFRYDVHQNEWTFVIESENADGRWSLFAQYTMTRR